MRIALAATCIADAMFPQAPQATVTPPRAARPRGRVPAGADLLRPDARQHRLPRRGGAGRSRTTSRRSPRSLDGEWDAVVVPSGSCTGSIRHQQAMVCRRAGRGRRSRPRPSAVAAKTYELSELLVDVLGVTDVGAYFPHRVTYHPTCHSLRMLQRRRQAAAAAARRRRHRPRRAARGRGLLRVRRDVRDQELRDVDGDARATR